RALADARVWSAVEIFGVAKRPHLVEIVLEPIAIDEGLDLGNRLRAECGARHERADAGRFVEPGHGVALVAGEADRAARLYRQRHDARAGPLSAHLFREGRYQEELRALGALRSQPVGHRLCLVIVGALDGGARRGVPP